MQNVDDIQWMMQALKLADKAQACGEVPIGAILVIDNQIVAEGWNQPITQCDPTAHAEIVAIRHASQRCNNYRLNHSTLYVTIEPCMMCLGAMMHARVNRLIYGAAELRSGILSHTKKDVYQYFNHTMMVQGGVLKDECLVKLQKFFQDRRDTNKKS